MNIRLVIGTALLIAPIKLDRRDIRRDLPFAVVAPLILGVLLWDGRLSRTDGAVLILVFAVWIGTTVLHALRERDATPKVLGTRSVGRAVALTFTGVGLLVAVDDSWFSRPTVSDRRWDSPRSSSARCWLRSGLPCRRQLAGVQLGQVPAGPRHDVGSFDVVDGPRRCTWSSIGARRPTWRSTIVPVDNPMIRRQPR